MKFKEGDWIEARFIGSVIFGYVETIYSGGKSCTLKIIRSDNTTNFHKTATIQLFNVIKFCDVELTRLDVKYLINLALDTKDEEWFMQLSDRLNHM